MSSTSIRSRLPRPIIVVLGLALAPLSAQDFDVSVVARGLAAPTGIAVGPTGTVYVTEVPEPGMMGGANRVARLETDGSLTTLSGGEPEPVNLAVDANGVLYWTCRSAGVVLRRDTLGVVAPFLRNLEFPTGIGVANADQLWITRVPTPGVPGGMGGRNTVDRVDRATGAITTVSMGEPEPVDIVADHAGNAWWTCKSAGVILAYDAATRTTRPLLTELDEPTGIALDAVGNLYFTEVPQPGVMGGRNRVWKYDLDRSVLTLISEGEPEPVDVTANADGSRVYWTCRTAGVIVMGTPAAARPTVDAQRAVAPGASVVYALRAMGEAGAPYFAATSLRPGSIPLGNGMRFPLAFDALFTATLGAPDGAFVQGYVGMLDLNGSAAATLAVPADAALAGLQLHTAFGTIDASGPMGVGRFSDTHVLRVD